MTNKRKKKQTFFKPNVPQPIKNLSWPQAKVKYPLLKPYGDADKDGLKNFRDCKPFDRTRKGKNHGEVVVSEDDANWERLTPKEKALAQEGLLDGW